MIELSFIIGCLLIVLIGVYLMKQIIRDFGLLEEEKVVLDLTKTMDVQKALSMPEQLPPQPGEGQPQDGGRVIRGSPGLRLGAEHEWFRIRLIQPLLLCPAGQGRCRH